MKIIIIVVCTLIFFGCGFQYAKPGTTQEETDKTFTQCRHEMDDALNVWLFVKGGTGDPPLYGRDAIHACMVKKGFKKAE